MTIKDAKRQLWNQIKDDDLIVGCGIGEDKKGEFISVYLAEATKDLKIPKEHKGYRVKTTVSGRFTPQ
jgi:hypothetical protein